MATDATNLFCDEVFFRALDLINHQTNIHIMNILIKAALTLSLTLSLGLTSVCVSAAESASASTASASSVISHIEKGLVEISKSDFSAAQVQLKAARTSSEALVGSSDKAKRPMPF